MAASLLDGKKVASLLHQDIQLAVDSRIELGLRPPQLAVILIGEDAPSQIYVENKRKACQEMGIQSLFYHLAFDIREYDLLSLISDLNENQEVDGILVQLPLPPHIDSKTIIEHINPYKDVDGFHPYNFGRLAQGNPLLRPCTPYGIIRLLTHYKLPLRGKNAVVVGASNIVGRPMALECLLAGSTVTICHRATRNLDEHIKNADIIIVATGHHGVINTEWLNKNHIVVDVGIHRSKEGKLQGDIEFDRAKEIVAWLTPVPGGVGPMTIATLLTNTLHAAELNQQKK
ncbi:bifunctional methylenetetrahydrofolate dehydrogenase/methenyltetrahydrofolate cyclohydrolase FolD [Legionella yabuuchiae]|uniref:bifunctional methylenetetrahydrofolate dehydrogenase/methenyltetrahydrofolate cyclohydrolase FolD n=1 Tax=Legionella yabuuchiae TaxID=376727 RepID=UPI001055CAE7|nr:bifunctional methylenetetrahydrofolate dehydrogenase/methenyltetrahydrofolate cyclohydrolase FolD [Legionella yabuuchiae]